MKIDKFLILIILSIFLLSFATYWQFRSFQKTLSKIELPKFEIPEFKIGASQKTEDYKEFVSPDGKLKIKYLTDWSEMAKEGLVGLNREVIKEGAQILLFAQKVKLEKMAFASLIIQELTLKEKKTAQEIIEEMKKEAEEKETEIEISNLKIENGEAIFHADYKRKGGSFFHSKEKVIFNENKTWIITILTTDRDWPEFEKEADEILNSTEVSSL